MDAAFAVVRTDIEVLCVEMQSNSIDSLSPTAEESIKHLCVQCEASLKFLHSLCQQNNFRDCLLKHKVSIQNYFYADAWQEWSYIIFFTFKSSCKVYLALDRFGSASDIGITEHTGRSPVFCLQVANCVSLEWCDLSRWRKKNCMSSSVIEVLLVTLIFSNLNIACTWILAHVCSVCIFHSFLFLMNSAYPHILGMNVNDFLLSSHFWFLDFS